MATEAPDLASMILAQLGQEFDVPEVDLDDDRFDLPSKEGNPLYDSVEPQDLDALTTGVVGGTGAFDRIMASTKAHLKGEYDRGAITGDQYTKAYIELTTAALGTALQFVLQGQQSYWQAIVAQNQARRTEIDAVKAGVELQIAKHQLAAASYQAEMLRAQHVLVQMQIANEDGKYGLVQQQILLVTEQTEAQRAQTLDTRSDDTTPVTGLMGKQKDLYTQQVTSYKRDAEHKFFKGALDTWIAQKAIDEGLVVPDELVNDKLDEIIAKMRENLELTTTP